MKRIGIGIVAAGLSTTLLGPVRPVHAASALPEAEVRALVAKYDWDVDKAMFVVWNESRYVPTVINPTGKYVGLFQVDWKLHSYTIERLQDPAENVAAAYRLYVVSGWSPWPVASTYKEPTMTRGLCPFATWRPTVNFGYHGKGSHNDNDPWLFVDHIMGGYKSTMDNKAWLDASGISSHFGIGKDGSISQYVNIFDSAYGNGRVGGPNGARTGINRYNRANPRLAKLESMGTWVATDDGAWWLSIGGLNAWNTHSISTEHEGVNQNDPWTEPMVQADIKVKRWCNEELQANRFATIPYNREGIIGHNDIDAVDRPYCPGPGRPLDRIIAELQGDDEMFNVLAYGKVSATAAPDYRFDLDQLGIPRGAKRVRMQVWTQGPPIEFYHGLDDPNNRDAGRVFGPYGIIEVIPSADGKCYVGPPGAVFDVSPLGWFN